MFVQKITGHVQGVRRRGNIICEHLKNMWNMGPTLQSYVRASLSELIGISDGVIMQHLCGTDLQ